MPSRRAYPSLARHTLRLGGTSSSSAAHAVEIALLSNRILPFVGTRLDAYPVEVDANSYQISMGWVFRRG